MSGGPPPITPDELLARFVTIKDWIRADKTIRQDAFIPPKDLNLSVTRHNGLSQDQLWQVGQAVVDEIAAKQNARLHGRADITAAAVTRVSLRAVSFPVSGNPRHAHISGWPTDKPGQKILAQQLAAAASFVPKPTAQ